MNVGSVACLSAHTHGRHTTSAAHVGRTGTALEALKLLFLALATGEGAELVDEVHHDVGVDGVAPGVAALGGRERAADVALLLQDVVELHADGGSAVFEERLGNLRVPEQFVGVHRVFNISSARIHGEVGR